MNHVVLLRNVWKSYITKEEIRVLEDVELSVSEGEFVAILGPSGSGKTTLLNLIGAIDIPDRGSVVILGTDITKLDEHQKANFRNRHIGFVFQFHYLVPEMNVLENVALPLIVRYGKLGKDTLEEAKRLLEELNMHDRMYSYPSELSGGEAQRVAIARALVGKPSIVLADEPTGNLDEENKFRVMEIFNSLKGRITLIFATHDTSLLKYADRVYRIEHRKLVPY